MSEANREVIRQCFALHRERRYAEIVERYYHEDAEWVDPPEFPDAGVHRGHEAIVRFQESWAESWTGDFAMRLDEIMGEGDVLATLGTFLGAGQSSGTPVAVEYGQVWTFRDGRVARVETMLDPSEALARLESPRRA